MELSWVDSGSQAELGTVFVDLRLSRESYFRLDLETYPDKAFWIVVGCLRDGVVSRRGRVWVHVREVGMWTAFTDGGKARTHSNRVGDRVAAVTAPSSGSAGVCLSVGSLGDVAGPVACGELGPVGGVAGGDSDEFSEDG